MKNVWSSGFILVAALFDREKMAKLARFTPNLKNPPNYQRSRPKRKVSSPDRYQPEKYGK